MMCKSCLPSWSQTPFLGRGLSPYLIKPQWQVIGSRGHWTEWVSQSFALALVYRIQK